MKITPAEFRKRLASRTFDSLYLFVGDDEQDRERAVNEIVAAAGDPGMLAFNCDRLRGDEATGARIVDCANTLAMMADRRFVIVSHAEALDESDEPALERYLRQPSPHTCLVFVALKLDGRRRLTGWLSRMATVVEFRAPEDPRGAERWVSDYARRLGTGIDAAAVGLLVEHLGADVARLGPAVEKAALFAANNRTIGVEAIRAMLGPAAAPEVFAMTNGIGAGDAGAALAAARQLVEEGEHPLKLLALIGWYIRTRMDRTTVRPALDRVLDTDVKMKTGGGDQAFLLERLLVDLCALGRRARPRTSAAGGAAGAFTPRRGAPGQGP